MADISASSESMALASLKTKIIAAPEQMARLRAGLKPTDCFEGRSTGNIKKPIVFSWFFHVFFHEFWEFPKDGVMGSLVNFGAASPRGTGYNSNHMVYTPHPGDDLRA